MIYCKACKEEVEPFTSEQVFGNGVMHIRADCPICGGYLKYLPQYLTDEETTIPFGKHKGTKLSELPKEYLKFLIENNIVKGSLKKSIEKLYGEQM